MPKLPYDPNDRGDLVVGPWSAATVWFHPPITRYQVASPTRWPQFRRGGKWRFQWTPNGRRRWWPFLGLTIGQWCYRLGHPWWRFDWGEHGRGHGLPVTNWTTRLSPPIEGAK